MRVKCTITIDDREYSTTVHGPAPRESVVADAIAGCLAAINTVDGNIVGSFITANLCLSSGVTVLNSAGWAHLHLDMEDNDRHQHALIVNSELVGEDDKLPFYIVAVDDVDAVRAKLKGSTDSQ